MSYAAAVVAAVCFGVGTVLEATAARRSTAASHLDPRLILRLFAQWVFLVSLAVSSLGVAATALALRHLPLFTVQATLASSVAVAAVIASIAHHEPLTAEIRGGVAAVVGGLTLLAVASGDESSPSTSLGLRLGLVAAALAALGLAALIGRRPDRSALAVGLLGGSAGLLYGVGNVGLRTMRGFLPADLVTDPAAWAAGIGAVGGVLVLATTLQRGSVALTAGAVTVTETVVPALAGLILLGERPRPGWGPAAAVGFVVAVGGAALLCRDVPEPDPAL